MQTRPNVASGQKIIMNHSAPPSAEDMEMLASEALASLPEEIQEFCESLSIRVEEWPEEAGAAEEDPYDLLALYRSGKEIAPGVEKKTANDDDLLVLYRRPVLDMWCESGDDLTALIRQIMIEELGRYFEFSEEEIDELTHRHYQGML